MKKMVLSIVLVLFSLSCSPSQPQEKARLRIVTSFYPMYIFVSNITKDVPGVEVVNLTDQSAGGLHDYVFTPKDMKKLENADVFVINNHEHETFVKQIQQAYPSLNVIEASQEITPLRLTHFEEEDDDHDHHHEHGTIDVHFWVSPLLAIQEVHYITKNLVAIDEDYTDVYVRNAQNYTQDLALLYSSMKEKLAPFSGRGVITYHDAFSYLFKDIGIKLLATLQLEPGVAPTPKELKKIEDLIKSYPGTPIFREPQYSSTLADNLAKESGASVYLLDPIVTGPNDLNAYQDIMVKNIENLVTALEKK